MRHRKAFRKLNRSPAHRRALMRSLAMALIRHERIITTVEKAKEARRFVEKLITIAKRGTLHARRLVLARLSPPVAKAEIRPAAGVLPGEKDPAKLADPTHVIIKLFRDIAPRFADRPGGYTRVIKRSERRLGDGGKTAYLELLKAGETKVQKRSAGPAPRVAPPAAPAPAPAPAAPQAQTEAPPANPPAAPEAPPSPPPAS